MNDILTGKLIRLSAPDTDELGRAFSKWSRDSEYWRLMAGNPVTLHSAKDAAKSFEKDVQELSLDTYFFGARTLADDALIGEMTPEVENWTGRDAFVGLSIGERANWGKGYGTDMMKVLLRFAFTEVNLLRVTLTVFEYNPRAIRSYEKAGFRHEGRMRKILNRDGRRWDVLFMGVLRDEWKEQNEHTN